MTTATTSTTATDPTRRPVPPWSDPDAARAAWTRATGSTKRLRAIDLQRALNWAACGVLVVDGEVGPATEAAWKRWEETKARGLPEFADEATAARIRARALELAAGLLDVREAGGNNRGDKVEGIIRFMGGRAGDAWCAMFTCYCLEIAARGMGWTLHYESGGCDNLAARTPYLDDDAWQYAPAGAHVFRRAAPGSSDLVHVELLRTPPTGPEAWCGTIGGNTSSGLSADGSGVFDHPRFLAVEDPKHGGYAVSRFVRLRLP